MVFNLLLRFYYLGLIIMNKKFIMFYPWGSNTYLNDEQKEIINKRIGCFKKASNLYSCKIGCKQIESSNAFGL